MVATTIPSASCISRPTGSISVASERPACRLKTLVESQASTFTPASPSARNASGSNASPTSGVGSALKSPLCRIRPAGVSMTSAELSGIECAIGRNPTVNGPACTTCGQGASWRTALVSCPARSIFPCASAAVKRRACTGAFSRCQSSPSAPTWSSCPWVMKIASSRSARAWIQAGSAMISSTPGVDSMVGKLTPMSTRMKRSAPSGP